jgi:hypothetical protein
MSIARFSRPLLSTFVAAAIAIGRLSVAHAAPDACAALTAADISSALGHPVGPPNPGENGEGGGQCEYGFEVSNQPSFNQFAPGVGDGAFSKIGVLAATKAAEWVAVRGSRGIQIAVITANPPPHDRLRALMLTALSR